MSLALNRGSALKCFERGNTMEICNGIMFNFYPGLPHIPNLTKESPWAEHLTSLPKRGVGAFLKVQPLITKEHPCHVYSDLMHSKQIIGQTVTYNGTTSGFEVES